MKEHLMIAAVYGGIGICIACLMQWWESRPHPGAPINRYLTFADYGGLILAVIPLLMIMVGFSDAVLWLAQAMVALVLYELLLLLLLPFLRQTIRAWSCAALWLLPSIWICVSLVDSVQGGAPLLVLRLPHWAWIAVVIWLVVALAILAVKLMGHHQFRKQLEKTATPITDPAVLAIWEQELENARITDKDQLDNFGQKCLTLLQSDLVQTPLSVGFHWQQILVVLPRTDYTPEELSLIFRHELIHIGHHDADHKLSQTIITALGWFNPLMWMGMARQSEDLELCCDEAVLLDADQTQRRKYADLLLTTAQRPAGLTTCLSASATALRYRLKNVVQPQKRRAGILAVGLFGFFFAAMFGLVAVGVDAGTAEQAVFSDGGSAAYVSRLEGNYSENQRAELVHYVSGLELTRVYSGLEPTYGSSEQDQMLSFCFGQYHRGGLVLTLYPEQNLLSAESLEEGRRVYQVEGDIDMALLSSLLHPEQA